MKYLQITRSYMDRLQSECVAGKSFAPYVRGDDGMIRDIDGYVTLVVVYKLEETDDYIKIKLSTGYKAVIPKSAAGEWIDEPCVSRKTALNVELDRIKSESPEETAARYHSCSDIENFPHHAAALDYEYSRITTDGSDEGLAAFLKRGPRFYHDMLRRYDSSLNTSEQQFIYENVRNVAEKNRGRYGVLA